MATEATWVHRTARGAFAGPLDGARRRHVAASQLSLLYVLALTDFRARYRGQALGLTWSLLYPLAMVGVFSVVFRNVARVDLPHYPVYVLMGMVYWQLCTRAWPRATLVHFSQRDLSKRATFPRYLLPAATVLSSAVSFAIESLLVFALAAASPGSLELGWAWLALPVLAVLLVALLVGLAVATSSFCPFFRDVSFLVETLLLFLFWGTPIFYPLEALPAWAQPLVELNPLTCVLVALRTVLMHGTLPSGRLVALCFAWPLIALLTGALVYRLHAPRISDQL